MQPACGMFLNDEARGAFDFFWNGLSCRFAGLFEVAFAFVFGQRHYSKLNPNCTDDTRASAVRRRSRLAHTTQRLGTVATKFMLRSEAARRPDTERNDE